MKDLSFYILHSKRRKLVIEIPCTDRDRKENWWDSLWKTTMNVTDFMILKILKSKAMVNNWQFKGRMQKNLHFSFSYCTFTVSIAQADDFFLLFSLTQYHYKVLLPSSSRDEHSNTWRKMFYFLFLRLGGYWGYSHDRLPRSCRSWLPLLICPCSPRWRIR